MDSPGYDPASVTGLAASGANLVAFTTGRGSCFGFKPVPSFKIASNSNLFHRMREDMDFNAGEVLEGKSIQEVGYEMFLRLLATASGEKTCSEQLGIGDEEFVPCSLVRYVTVLKNFSQDIHPGIYLHRDIFTAMSSRRNFTVQFHWRISQ